MTDKCLHCNKALTRVNGRLVHAEGGGRTWQSCDRCGWEGTVERATGHCPNCGEAGLWDEHVATVKDSEVRA